MRDAGNTNCAQEGERMPSELRQQSELAISITHCSPCVCKRENEIERAREILFIGSACPGIFQFFTDFNIALCILWTFNRFL